MRGCQIELDDIEEKVERKRFEKDEEMKGVKEEVDERIKDKEIKDERKDNVPVMISVRGRNF